MPDAQQQQLMPWGHLDRVELKSGRIQGVLPMHDVVYSVTQEGLRLSLVIQCEVGGRADGAATGAILRLDVGTGATCTIRKLHRRAVWQSEYHSWSLGLSDDNGDGAFAKLRSWVQTYLMGLGTGTNAEHRQMTEALRGILVFVQRHALGLCDPHHLNLARQYHQSMRLEVYGELVQHGARFAQMALACPGVIIMIRAIQRSGRVGCEKPVIAAIDLGAPLADVIDETWKCWQRSQNQDVNGRVLPSKIQRQLIRRAPAGIERRFVTTSLPPGIDISDIPDDIPKREIWYQIVWFCRGAIARHETADERGARTLAGFFSRHALAIAAHAAQTHRTAAAVVFEIVDYGLRSGERVPSRRRAPAHVFQSVQGWHVAAWRHTKHAPETPLAACELSAPVEPLIVKALETVADLQKESRVMQHCIASYANQAVDGTLFVFRASFGDERLTIALKKSCGRLRLHGIGGKRNEIASASAKLAAQEWLAAESAGEVDV